MTTALLAPMLLGLAGGVTDLYIFVNHKDQLQATADAAVLAAASETSIKGWNAASLGKVAQAMIHSNPAINFAGVELNHTITVDEENRSVRLQLEQDHYSYFFLSYFTGSPQITVTAQARAAGQATLCVIVRAPSTNEAFRLMGDSQLQAAGCSAYSNSSSTSGVTTKDTSRLVTQMTCSSGGYKGQASSFAPVPITDCPVIQDPLAARAKAIDAKLPTTCAATNMKLHGQSRTLSAGLYCGGLSISGGSKITLSPGIYWFKDGTLKVDKNSTLTGTSVGLAFVGKKAKLELKNESTVSLAAPTDGDMTGILIYGQATAAPRKFSIESRNAQKFLGTVYVPSDELTVGGDRDGDGACDVAAEDQEDDEDDDGDDEDAGSGAKCSTGVGGSSDWTAIIAHTLKITAGVRLVLNSDYASSTVPVPVGIGPTSQKLMLVK